MPLNSPIVLIEDDENDVEVITSAIKELGIKNEVTPFASADTALKYLLTTENKTFVILCDIRMPNINGLEFRKSIIQSDYLKKKTIPFVFFTGAVSQDIIDEAYTLDVQGFFKKAHSFEGLKAQLSAIYFYWRSCLHPNIKF
jgi:CheY-like chemotaxis protein